MFLCFIQLFNYILYTKMFTWNCVEPCQIKICCIVKILIFILSSGNTTLMEVKINLQGKHVFVLVNFVMISSIQKCSRQKKVKSAPIKKGSGKLFDEIFVLIQVTHENGEPAKRIHKKNLKLHPTAHWPHQIQCVLQ